MDKYTKKNIKILIVCFVFCALIVILLSGCTALWPERPCPNPM